MCYEQTWASCKGSAGAFLEVCVCAQSVCLSVCLCLSAYICLIFVSEVIGGGGLLQLGLRFRLRLTVVREAGAAGRGAGPGLPHAPAVERFVRAASK